MAGKLIHVSINSAELQCGILSICAYIVESAPFVSSTSFCSLSSWFSSCYAHDRITRITGFALTFCHFVGLSFKSENSPVSQILSSIVFRVSVSIFKSAQISLIFGSVC